MPKNVIIHTDGACSGNPGPGGWGAILQYGKASKEISGGVADTTNNRMELVAVVEALSALKAPCTVVVKSDSAYVITGMMVNMHRWRELGWRRKGGALIHADLWQKVYDLCQTHKVVPVWIPGHSGDPLNERADQLASLAIPA